MLLAQREGKRNLKCTSSCVHMDAVCEYHIRQKEGKRIKDNLLLNRKALPAVLNFLDFCSCKSL